MILRILILILYFESYSRKSDNNSRKIQANSGFYYFCRSSQSLFRFPPFWPCPCPMAIEEPSSLPLWPHIFCTQPTAVFCWIIHLAMASATGVPFLTLSCGQWIFYSTTFSSVKRFPTPISRETPTHQLTASHFWPFKRAFPHLVNWPFLRSANWPSLFWPRRGLPVFFGARRLPWCGNERTRAQVLDLDTIWPMSIWSNCATWKCSFLVVKWYFYGG